MIRLFTWLLSIAVHAALALFLLDSSGGLALQKGSGEDLMVVVQQSPAIQNLASLGSDAMTAQEILPQRQRLAEVPSDEVQEVKPAETTEVTPEQAQEAETVEDAEVIESDEGPQQELEIQPEVKEVEPQPTQEITMDYRPDQVATMRGAAQSGGGSTSARKAFIGSLRKHIENFKPQLRSKSVGYVIVEFTIDGSGELLSSKVIKSSGHAALDDAALASVRQAAPYPAIPSELSQDSFTMKIPYRFSIAKN
ncbi:TonB family protein [Methyloligella sp. 2.7D]|uniref:energy transducer TonB family protein n=1 Tax=unclassified Methyloligella TaxID=2625955 RepID=UPI00157C707F|nr:TonB family protein [Methyloligella sp. GL2]QKP76731.1 energy transducer TonB [Methyloligella sp. GL2]